MGQTALQGSHLSLQQQRLWSFLASEDGIGQAITYTSGAFLLEGPLDSAMLERALASVVSQNEILRTAFYPLPGMDVPMQIISRSPAYIYTVEQVIKQGTGAQLQDIVTPALASLGAEKADFARGRPVRVHLLKLDEQRHVLLLRLPLLCADSASLKHLLTHVSRAYATLWHGGTLSDEDQPLQYADVAAWQDDLLREEDAATHRTFWKQVDHSALADTERVVLHLNVATAPGRQVPAPCLFTLPATQIQQIEHLAEATQSSSEAVLLAAWYVLLWRMMGTSFPLGLSCDGRHYEDLADALGLYTRLVPLSPPISPELSFERFLRQVAHALREAVEEQSYFTWEAPAEEKPSPVTFPCSFAFETWSDIQVTPHLRLSPLTISSALEPSLLTLTVRQHEGTRKTGDATLCLCLETKTGRVQAATMQRLADALQTLLEQALRQPESSLAELPLLTTSQQQHLLSLGRGPERSRRTSPSLVQLFQQHVARHPEHLALVASDRSLSYAQLNEQANRLAHLLRTQGVGPQSFVGLLLPRTSHLLISLLAVLKLGAAYVPLDPSFPAQRLRTQVANLTPHLLLTLHGLRIQGLIPQDLCPQISLDTSTVQRSLAACSGENLASPPQPGLVYVIFTSGSTGTPKAVLIEHLGLLNYTLSLLEALDLPPGLHFATVSTLAADLGNTSLFASLLSGGCLHLLDYDIFTSPYQLLAYSQQWPLDVLKLVPSHLLALLASCSPSQQRHLLPRRFLILGGERLSPSLLTRIAELEPSCEVVNHYGPTETTIGVLVHRLGLLRHGLPLPDPVPLGRPLANTQALVLDPRGHLVPLGTPGELFLAGDGLARGYWQQEEQTRARFVPNPFADSAAPPCRLYRTGDRVRMDEQGRLTFLGRSDSQVKLRGYRIELGEIEAQLGQHEQVQEAVVVLHEQGEQSQLVAYVVCRGQQVLRQAEVRQYLQQRLPDYMVPSLVLFLPRLPLTPNGKIDHRQLPDPSSCKIEDQQQDQQVYIKPRDSIEAHLHTIWAELLLVPGISVLENFFDLGGNSLTAVRLMSRIQQQFGQDLPLTVLFKHPTIEGMATLLRHQDYQQQEKEIIIPLQPRGLLPPFFCVHPAGGTVFSYQALAKHLGTERPFYGLQAPDAEALGLSGASLEELATCYVTALQEVQPRGPYYLGGWSLGGVIAFEIAQQLLQRGEEVASLVLFDSGVPISYYRQPQEEPGSPSEIDDGRLAEEMIAEGVIAQPGEAFCQLTPAEKLVHVWEQARLNHSIPHDTSFDQFRRLSRRQYANIRAVSRYIPSVYPRAITLFRSSESLKAPESQYDEVTARRLQPTGGWEELTTERVEIHVVPGRHADMMDEPHVQELAEALRNCLEK